MCIVLLQPEYSPGFLTQAVDTVKAAGVAYFGAVGNWQGSAWESEASWVTVGNRSLFNFGTAASPSTTLELTLYKSGTAARLYLHVSAPAAAGPGLG